MPEVRAQWLFAVLAALVLAGCAAAPKVSVNGRPIERAEEVRGMVSSSWQQATVATFKLKPGERYFVCLDSACKTGAHESIRAYFDGLGFKTVDDKKDATYVLRARGFITAAVEGKNGERIVAPVFALPPMVQKDADVTLAPWIPAGGKVNDLNGKGLTTFSMVGPPNVVVYDTLWHQTGQLAQTIGGGSPGAYLAGALLIPVLNLIGATNARNSLQEGLAGIELAFIENGKGFNTIRPVYGFAASTERESPAALLHEAMQGALRATEEFLEKETTRAETMAKDGGA